MSSLVKKISFLISVFILSGAVGYVIFAAPWAGPDSDPPLDNVEPPVRQGGDAGLNDLTVAGTLGLPTTGITGAGDNSGLDADMLWGYNYAALKQDFLDAAGGGTGGGGAGPLLEWYDEPDADNSYVGTVQLGPATSPTFAYKAEGELWSNWEPDSWSSGNTNYRWEHDFWASGDVGEKVYIVAKNSDGEYSNVLEHTVVLGQSCGNSVIEGGEFCDDGDIVWGAPGDCAADCSGTNKFHITGGWGTYVMERLCGLEVGCTYPRNAGFSGVGPILSQVGYRWVERTVGANCEEYCNAMGFGYEWDGTCPYCGDGTSQCGIDYCFVDSDVAECGFSTPFDVYGEFDLWCQY